jgi:hypothetical protein
MKKLLMAAAVLFTATLAQAQNPPASPRDSVETAHLKINYGRPSVKGRTIFGDLVPYDQVWRTGANQATEITFKHDGTFAGKPVKAGTYSFFTIPGKTEWTVILNPELKQWGSMGYDKIKGKNVLEAKVPSKQLGSLVEQFTITASDKAVTLSWEKTEVSIPVKF